MKIISQKEMPLLARKRVNFELEHPKAPTPSKESIKADVAKQFNVKPELIAIRHVYPKFGQNKSKVIVHIYQDEKTLKFLEPPKGKKSAAKKTAPK